MPRGRPVVPQSKIIQLKGADPGLKTILSEIADRHSVTMSKVAVFALQELWRRGALESAFISHERRQLDNKCLHEATGEV